MLSCPEGDGHQVHIVGESIAFSGYVDDFERSIAAVEFSLDDGAHWTRYATPGARSDKGVHWQFAYTPQEAGLYRLRVRAVNGEGEAAYLVQDIPFEVHAPEDGRASAVRPAARAVPEGVRIRALGGGPLEGARIFRSGELFGATSADVALIERLGIRTIFDIRTRREVAKRPDPRIVGVSTVALEPGESRRKDADKRLVAGVIGEYGVPEQRMCANYRRYVGEYPLLGTALRTMAAHGEPTLVHCANGKDRTGVLCAVVQRIAGVHEDDIVADYLAYNEANADLIAAEAERLGAGMTADERAILLSFLEARPTYLQAFFDEVDERHGAFDAYMRSFLRLTSAQQETIAAMVGA